MSRSMTSGGDLGGWLFGRRTYERRPGHWNNQPDNALASALNEIPK